VTTSRRRGPGGGRLLVPALLLAAVLTIASGVAPAGAGTPVKKGTYGGHTTQAAVATNFRTIQFKVTKGKVTLTAEPTVARDACTSAPVFTIDGNTPSKKLGRGRTFTITHTFLGNKIDKIFGRFVSSDEIDGYAIYHFNAQDLCSAGKSKVNYSASRK